MTDNEAFLTRVTDGIAEVIVSEGTRREYAAKPTGGKYPAGKVGIYRTTSPESTAKTQSPSLTITLYMDVLDVETDVFVQFKILGYDERDCDAIEADLYDAFQERWGGNLGSVELKLASRSSGATLGQDTNGRLGRTENYAFTVFRPTPHRSS